MLETSVSSISFSFTTFVVIISQLPALSSWKKLLGIIFEKERRPKWMAEITGNRRQRFDKPFDKRPVLKDMEELAMPGNMLSPGLKRTRCARHASQKTRYCATHARGGLSHLSRRVVRGFGTGVIAQRLIV